ncbi:flavodoxin family protein [bacterium]|nr:flavodoxin family protein [bacterium]
MKKIIGIVGSGRRNSNSERLLEAALNSAAKHHCTTEIIDILDMNFSGCNECNECLKTGRCIIKDDLTQIYDRLASADGIIISAPVYFYSLPGQLKLFVDRFQALWARRYILGIEPERERIGGLISIAGSKGKRVFDGVILPIKYFFIVQGVKLIEPLLFREWNGNPEDLPDNFVNLSAEYGEKLARMI